MKLRLNHLRKDEFAKANIRLIRSKLVGEEIDNIDFTNKAHYYTRCGCTYKKTYYKRFDFEETFIDVFACSCGAWTTNQMKCW
ncbi:hypothetical protein [Paenibacillus agilis]|uniref:Uncharacterized protein n=1 Tax=Paenibacillus agilis TaxID=3020863 RepID=A0A559IEQ7_9BACL|nr:hypothetical protein [Paenibacillus agilis]TVX85953.1 hypothetical protein FPZ44_23660 [Paenibacillus agilis]